MTYELAKQLKDAGFSLGCRWCKVCLDSDAPTGEVCLSTLDCACHLPSLSELIVVCVGDFGGLDHFPYEIHNKFRAYSRNSIRKELYGLTPEEAVAKLWLALNKKDEANISH